MKKIQVIIAEDQAMVLGALATLLETEPDIAVCAKAANGREALAAISKHRPDVLVTNIEMPEMTGLTLASEVRALSANPGRNSHYLRAAWLSSPRSRRGSQRIFA